MPVPVAAPDAYAVVPDAARRCRRCCAALRGAARRRRARAACTPAGADGLGSMKSQFKKADASGARYALIFGADELARGEVDRQGAARRRAARRRSRPLADAGRAGRRAARRTLTTIAGSASSTTSMATHLDLEEQEQLDELKHFWKQYGNLITWVADRRARRLRRLERLAVLAAHQAAQASALYDEVERAAQAGDVGAGRARLRRHARTSSAAPPTRSRPACWPPRCWPTRARPTPPGQRWPGWPTSRPTRATRPSPGCAWPALLVEPRPTTRRSSSSSRRAARRSSRRWSPTAAATSC